MAATRLRIFISSVQKEFAQVRSDLKAFLLGDAVLQRFVASVFLFEELPAKDQRADEVYLSKSSDATSTWECSVTNMAIRIRRGCRQPNTSTTMPRDLVGPVWCMSGVPMKRNALPKCGNLSARPVAS